ncbi:hypothetical protein SteCoe_28698 [Stentor coeruleus]|uniref:Uncharacterized protein n=1 Tax=Stentor coeruleus TaxID=5963 RepID=A0A1R2B825_9CILI|nr:hypothetical protein SteCoe_28698 [Stentor coeruleus]
MGNCCNSKHLDDEAEKNAKEMSVGIKGQIAVLTFAGPQSCFQSFQQDNPPTFSDPNFFSQKRSIAEQSLSREASMN